MPNPMRDYLEERERKLEARVAELEAALQKIMERVDAHSAAHAIAALALDLATGALRLKRDEEPAD